MKVDIVNDYTDEIEGNLDSKQKINVQDSFSVHILAKNCLRARWTARRTLHMGELTRHLSSRGLW